jgi:hypothetical protein
LAQRCGPDAKVIAVDPWAAAMKRLSHKVEYLNLHNVQLAVQDWRKYPFDPLHFETMDDALRARGCSESHQGRRA